MGENDFHHLTAGWHPLEHVPDPIRWTSKASDFLLRAASCQELFVEATVWGKDLAARTVRGRIELEGQDLGPFCVESNRWNILSFRLPGPLADPVVQGRILTEETWVPAEEGLGGDTRQLGIAVRRIWVA